ncbi:MAG: hypothetical protein PHO89_01295 [Methylacidiphilaceae bacterium]|nr:hypothetical protein [Candidatus Methylacidiphilaceae bacterium]
MRFEEWVRECRKHPERLRPGRWPVGEREDERIRAVKAFWVAAPKSSPEELLEQLRSLDPERAAQQLEYLAYVHGEALAGPLGDLLPVRAYPWDQWRERFRAAAKERERARMVADRKAEAERQVTRHALRRALRRAPNALPTLGQGWIEAACIPPELAHVRGPTEELLALCASLQIQGAKALVGLEVRPVEIQGERLYRFSQHFDGVIVFARDERRLRRERRRRRSGR